METSSVGYVQPRAAVAGLILLTLLSWCALSEPSLAVVINVGDGSGNTTAPEDDFGFHNVGIRGFGSAIYLGNRWVLTASHVNAGPTIFNGIEYEHIPEETRQLQNDEEGLSDLTDIVLYRLEEEPDLPALRLPCTPVRIGTEISLAGQGHDRHPDIEYWDVQTKSGNNNDVWTRVETEEESNRQGFSTLTSQSVRWGNALTTLTRFDINSSFGDVLSFQSTFDPDLGVDLVGQAVRGDSGGGVFQKNRGVWELVGMIHAVGVLENQPGGTLSAYYGDKTYIADLHRYGDQLRALASFEPAAGDLNGDGLLDDVDIDLLFASLDQSTFPSCHLDFDSNNELNDDDVTILLASVGTLLGDANLDGEVGFLDFLIVSQNFGTPAEGWVNGDFNGDNQTDFIDFLILSGNFGELAIGTPSVAAVPEPEMAPLLSVLFVFLLNRIRGRREK